MKNITLKQLRSDFNYLEENVVDYLVDEDILVNYIWTGIIDGTVNIRQAVMWGICDLVQDVVFGDCEEYLDFLKTDKRASRILKRYGIDIDVDYNPFLYMIDDILEKIK